MKGTRFCSWISFAALLAASTAALFVIDPNPVVGAKFAPPPSSTIQQQFRAPLGLGLRTGGWRDSGKRRGYRISVRPVMCDDHDLNRGAAPRPAATFLSDDDRQADI